MLLFDLKIYENSCKTHIRVLSYFVRLILSGNLYTVLNWWNRNFLPFRSTWVHPRFLVAFELLDLSFICNVLYIAVCPFIPFLLTIVLSVLLQFTYSDYHFGIFKLLWIHCQFLSVLSFLGVLFWSWRN